jgi:hypothetical protein
MISDHRNTHAMVALLRIAPEKIGELRQKKLVTSSVATKAAGGLIGDTWKILKVPSEEPGTVDWAKGALETVKVLDPNSVSRRFTLGGAPLTMATLDAIVQLRTGLFSEALAALAASNDTYGGTPVEFAFMAMAMHELGQKSEAMRHWEVARQLMLSKKWRESADLVAITNEVSRLLTGEDEIPVEKADADEGKPSLD